MYRLVPAMRRSFLIALAGSFALALTDGLVILAALPLIGSVIGSGGQPALIAWLQKSVGLDASLSAEAKGVLGITFLLSGVILREFVAGVFQTSVNLMSVHAVMRLRELLMVGLLRSDFAYVDRLESGRLRQTIMTEMPQVGAFLRSLVSLLAGVFTLILMLALVLYATPQLLLLTIALLPFFIGWKLFYVRLLYRHSTQRVEAGHALANLLNEAVLGLRQLKLTNRQDEFGTELHAISRRTERSRHMQFMLITWEPLLIQMSALFLILALIWIAPHLGMASFYEVAIFAFLLYRLVPIVAQCNSNFNALLVNEPSVSSVLDSCRECERAREHGLGVGAAVEDVRNIRFEDVSLKFRKRDERALDGVSIEASRGEIIGIVGLSGAGKSSLIHVLLGMYAPSAGRVLLDGHDISGIDLLSLRRTIGVVSQDVHLFNTSIREVIAGGNLSMPDPTIEQAAHLAGIDNFIDRLPAKYRTRVGERGMTLSGGQRQRLLLAQVLARKPSVIIFDEATSALDGQNEQRIFDTIDGLRADHICLVVTHRVERLRNATRIYVMDAGRVVQTGTWDELTARPGPFQDLRQGVDEPPSAIEAVG